MASSLVLTIPRNVVSPEPQIAKENVPPSAFKRPNRDKTTRKPLARVFDTQTQTAAVNFGDDDSSPNLLYQCASIFSFILSLADFHTAQSSIFSLQQAVRNNGAKMDADHGRMTAWIESLESTWSNNQKALY